MNGSTRTDGATGGLDRATFTRDERRSRAFQNVSGLLGRKWHIGILYQLSRSGGMGFSRLQEEIDGVSGKMLSESLDRLETEYGVVERTIVNDQPLRVEYSLTERGETLEPTITEIAEWAYKNRAAIVEPDEGSE